MTESLVEDITRLKRQKNAVILGHYYLRDEMQDIADFVGDSLALSKQAMQTKANIIVFCGVHFMAETAKILNPDKRVLLPDIEAGCSLADSCKAADLQKLKDQHPNAMVVSYINCTAEVKTLSDIICTSGNALQIVNQLPKNQEILFVPDKNLGDYINKKTGRQMILWDGVCHVHNQLIAERIIQLKQQHPEAALIAHPECTAPVLALADFVGSTAAMLKFVQTDTNQSYIVATESGILYQMRKLCPNKLFYIAESTEQCGCNDCPYMKLNTLEKLYQTLLNETPEIILSEETIRKAQKPLLRML
ncbi:quinolinate synthase A [Bacteroidia bacterium]|nr:quinolinate synthase A [Bacteroidia bacterium]